MIFEIAKESDFDAVNRLARQVSAHHAQWDSNIKDVEHPYPLDWFQECTKPESIHDSVIYVARQNGLVVGYMRFYLWHTGSYVTERRTMLSIDDIGVEESLRNQGIGQQMMAKLREFARSKGCAALNLYVDAPNESAIAFYEKCGLHIRNHGMSMTL